MRHTLTSHLYEHFISTSCIRQQPDCGEKGAIPSGREGHFVLRQISNITRLGNFDLHTIIEFKPMAKGVNTFMQFTLTMYLSNHTNAESHN